MKSDKIFSLTDREIKQLNDRHIAGVNKWLRMFMGLNSEVTKVENNVIHLEVLYSNKVKRSKAETVACTWLKSPNNAFLLRADTIIVNEYTDKGKQGNVVIFEEGMTREEIEEALNVQETERFEATRWFIGKHIFNIDQLLASN